MDALKDGLELAENFLSKSRLILRPMIQNTRDLQKDK